MKAVPVSLLLLTVGRTAIEVGIEEFRKVSQSGLWLELNPAALRCLQVHDRTDLGAREAILRKNTQTGSVRKRIGRIVVQLRDQDRSIGRNSDSEHVALVMGHIVQNATPEIDRIMGLVTRRTQLFLEKNLPFLLYYNRKFMFGRCRCGKGQINGKLPVNVVGFGLTGIGGPQASKACINLGIGDGKGA